MKRVTREEARNLRRQGLSIRAIAEAVGASKGSVSIWVRDIQLTESQRQALEQNQHQWGGRNKGALSNRERHRKRRAEYQREGREQARKGSRLHLMGCMLYWAEGAKTKRNSVYFANSDPNMLLLFMRFLREEYAVEDNAAKLQIHCHATDTSEIDRIEQYWINLLGLPSSSLMKTQTKKGSEYRRNRLEYGVCGINVHSTALVQQIYGAIQEYGEFDNPNWLQ